VPAPIATLIYVWGGHSTCSHHQLALHIAFPRTTTTRARAAMDSKVCVFQLALLGVALAALAGPNIAGGIMEVGLASSRVTGAAHAARQMMAQATTTMSVMGLEVHRRILDSISSSSSLNPDRAACLGACPGRGRPYTSRSCQHVYQCPSS
jgi:hypothetical protein